MEGDLLMKKKVPTEQEISKKHKVSVEYVTRQAEIGSTVEREHVTSHEEAYGIALQHINEFPDYYKHLLPMEKKLKAEWKAKQRTFKEFREICEATSPAQQAAIAVNMKKEGKKPKDMKEETVEEGAAWTRSAGKNKNGGLNEKGRKSYEREHPGSDLKAPSKKVGNPRRASFCARMRGMKKKLTSKKTARDPDSRINKSLRAWNC